MGNRANISFKVTPQDDWHPEWVLAWLRDVNTRFKVNQFTWDPPSITAATTVATTLTTASYPVLAEMRIGMVVSLSPAESLPVGISIAYTSVQTDGELTVALANSTAGAIDPDELTWTYLAVLP